MSQLPSNDAEFNLQQILLMMNQISQWLIRSGVGYTEFAAALKPIFYQQAVAELQRIEQKQTVSSISLLAGLHRKDVTAFRETQSQGLDLKRAKISDPMSVPARVIAVWVTEQWPQQLLFSHADEPSFECLVKKVSTERHPRSVLNELIRLGIVQEQGHQVILQKSSFIPDQTSQLSREILRQNLQSHLAAGLHNLFESDQITYMEESIRADELTAESVQLLMHTSVALWEQYSKQILELALKRSAMDEGQADANQVFCLGVYQSDQ